MITSFEIVSTSPVAGGHAFGTAGPLEELTAFARGEIDPREPANAAIANIELAPRNARGRIEYDTDVVLLRPADPAKRSGCLLYEVVNRGRRIVFPFFFAAARNENSVATLADLGNAMPLLRGWTLAWSGWDGSAPRGGPGRGIGMTAPLATENGAAIVRTIQDEFVSGTKRGVMETFRLSYECATRDPAACSLTVRSRQGDAPRPVPWSFIDARTLRLLPEGALPQPGALYDFRYPARNPRVLGIGLAVTRDVVSFLRRTADGARSLGAPVRHVLAAGISQGARYLREHVCGGFNRDERGERVFDGALATVGGAGGVFLNELFAQPFRTRNVHEDRDFPENRFPFATAPLEDPLTGRTAALFRGDGSDPLFMQVNSSSEYLQKGASLLHTDPVGTRDVDPGPRSRVYLIASSQHDAHAAMSTERGACRNLNNPNDPSPVIRALLVALEDWVANGTEPPANRVPTLAGGTLCTPEELRFPAIPGVRVALGLAPVEAPSEWGTAPGHPAARRTPYRALISQVDADGNELAGVRTPDIAAPLGTHTGWNEFAPPYPEGESGGKHGSFFPFARTRADRLEAGDPRASLEERYADRAAYVARVQAAAQGLVAERLLLPEDAVQYVERARSDERFPG